MGNVFIAHSPLFFWAGLPARFATDDPTPIFEAFTMIPAFRHRLPVSLRWPA